MRDIRDHIAGALAEMPAVNHHEHCWQAFSAADGLELDLPHFLYQGYLADDLGAAGYGRAAGQHDALGDRALPDETEAAWAALRPYLDRVRNTSYFRYLLRTLRDLFEIDEADLFSERWRAASERVQAYTRRHKGRGAELCARMKISATILDANLGPTLLSPVDATDHPVVHIARLDMFIHEERGLAETLQRNPCADFESWLAVFDATFQRSRQAGAAGFKSGLAYNRRIEYSDPSKEQAARIFEDGVLHASPADQVIYQDFLVNRLCRLCAQAGLPLQIHTGLQADLGHVIEEARPTLLTSLFRRHGDLRVDLFHGGYPWHIPAGLLAKYFPNVTIDGCWLAQVSPSAYRAALTSWIETLPMTKIFAWGGDHNVIEHSYGSLLLAKDLLADVLADLVGRGYFDVELALAVARRILHDNGVDFWRLGMDR